MEEVGLERHTEYTVDKSFSMNKAQKKDKQGFQVVQFEWKLNYE